MASLRDDEVRRILAYLRKSITNSELLAEIEGELRGEFGQEYLREGDLLPYFTPLDVKLVIESTRWSLRIIPYTRMRMVQRAVSASMVQNIFLRFVEFCAANATTIEVGGYAIFGRPIGSDKRITLRIDIDDVNDEAGQAHTVTLFVGDGDTQDVIAIGVD